MTNSKGPRQEPWGTPQSGENCLESDPSMADSDSTDMSWTSKAFSHVCRHPCADAPTRYWGVYKAATFLSDARQSEVSFFSLLICLDATKFVLLSVFTLIEMICPRSCSKSQPKGTKSLLPVDVRRSKRRCLNSLLWSTVSNVAPRSNRTIRMTCCEFIFKRTSLITLRKAVSVLWCWR